MTAKTPANTKSGTSTSDKGTTLNKNPDKADGRDTGAADKSSVQGGQKDSNPGDPSQNEPGVAGEDQDNAAPAFSSGLQASGEFRIGEKIILGIRNNNVLLRHSPQGDEIEVSETTVASVLIDAFFNPASEQYAKNIGTSAETSNL